MPSPVTDLLQAARTLLKARAFTLVCVISLGVGMGIVMAILLLLRLFGTPPGIETRGLAELVIRPSGPLLARAGTDMIGTWSYPDYLDVRDAARDLTITGWSAGEGLYTPADQTAAIALPTMYVSSNYFSTVGVALARGPGFTATDDASHAEPEAVISHRIWQVRFNGDPGIIGRTITINGTGHVIVGVTPDAFRGHIAGLDDGYYQLWLPLSRHPRLAGEESARLARDVSWVQALTRLPDGTTIAQADARVHAVMAGLATRYAATNADKDGGVEPYFPGGAPSRAQATFAQWMLLGLSGVVLLVVGLNISGMMLVRSAMRERELAVRQAMGASRWRLMRYHLTEALVLAVFGGSLASAILFGVPVIVAWAMGVWGPVLDLFTADPRLALQCLALCFVTTLVLGFLPALRFSRPGIIASLRNDHPGGGQRVGRMQRLTAAAQAGLAVPFLVMCGIQFDQARATAFADTGFTPAGLYAARLSLTALTATEDERQLFVRRVRDAVAQAPGVASAGVGDGVPLDFRGRGIRVAREGDSTFATVHSTRVEAGYLEAIGTRLLLGRAIDEEDRDGAEPVVMLSEPLARQLFPTGDPVGQRVALASPGQEPRLHTVVGVTADLVSTQMGNPRPQLFLALAQHPATTVFVVARGAPSDASMRAAFDGAVAEGLRAVASAAKPEDVFRQLITGGWLIQNSRSDLMTSSAVGGVAAGVALVLAALGVYGVIAFVVATRTREIGIRVALGASRIRVLRDVLGNALSLVVPGIGVGLLLAALWVHYAGEVWYQAGAAEPFIYALAAATSFVVAALAGVPSARRAAAVQPIVALKAE
ncbi:MAG: ABC transporter permease [Vicinamibacterales bacterium]